MLIEEIMTKLICHENSYIKEFDAKVTSIRETGIILDLSLIHI